jgi:hypothetical protein
LSQTVVFDSSAFISLFKAQSTAYDYWQRADHGGVRLLFPATAIAEANVALRASYNAWSVLLWPQFINVAPLDTSSAIETGFRHEHSLATSHVVHEARLVQGVVLTSDPSRYSGASVPELVI